MTRRLHSRRAYTGKIISLGVDEVRLLSQALQMVEAGEIQDAKTALGLLFIAGFRAGR